jgi:hypothetical protein
MIIVKFAALVLGLAVAATACPGFAQNNRISSTRAKAIQECSAEAGKYPEHTWGVWEIDIYRACMAQRGQQE